jgi:hypothetical protein
MRVALKGLCDVGVGEVGFWGQEHERIGVYSAGDALHALECQVALASLDAAHVGAVEAQDIGERLLAEATGLSKCSQVAAHRPLQIAFHVGNGLGSLLDGLHTYK